MHNACERVILGVGKGVLFREVSSVQECPHRGIPLYIKLVYICLYVCCIYNFSLSLQLKTSRQQQL